MEKILNIIKKFILSIPFLLICFSIKHVYAEDLEVDVAIRSFNMTIYSPAPENLPLTFLYKYKLNLYNNDFNFNYGYNNMQNFNTFVYYDETNNAYIFLNYLIPSSISDTSSDLSYNIDCSTGFISYKNSNDEWTSTDSANYYIIRNFVLSNEDKLLYVKNMASFDTTNIITTKSFQNFNYYYFNGLSEYHTDINKYICNNKNNLKLIYVYSDNLYIDNVKQEIYVEPEPEPEPETPTLPPYNFNDNKYYVPNYHEGQCVEVIDKDTIRVFDDEFTSFYTDYYINSNYISKTGQVDLDYEKNCSTLQFTDIRYYGNDLPQILFILFLILLFTIGFPYVLFKRFRKR